MNATTKIHTTEVWGLAIFVALASCGVDGGSGEPFASTRPAMPTHATPALAEALGATVNVDNAAFDMASQTFADGSMVSKVGTWATSTNATAPFGAQGIRSAGTGIDSYKFIPQLAATAENQDVFIHWLTSTNRTPAVHYTVSRERRSSRTRA